MGKSRTTKRRHAIMKDVAKACNVSISTVSLVLSQDERIPAKTKQKVLAAVQSFGYRPNVLARNLSKQSSMTIACVLPYKSFLNEAKLFNEMVTTIYESASANGFRVIFEMMTPQFIRRRFYLRLFRERAIDGMIILYPSLQDRFLHELKSYGSSVVVLGSTLDNGSLYTIVPDNVNGGFLAVNHLIQLGHRKIAFLSNESTLSWVKERFQGYEKAMKKGKLDVEESFLAHINFKPGASISDPIKETLGKFLESGVTAIFAASDLLAMETMTCLRQMGQSVPEDISVIGMDNLLSSAHTSPPLTTVNVSINRMASGAVEFLTMKKDRVASLRNFLDRLEKKDQTPQRFREVLDVELVERSSCQKIPIPL